MVSRLFLSLVRIMAVIRTTYLTDEGFTPEVAKRASPAAEGLCRWVHAMSSYDKVSYAVTHIDSACKFQHRFAEVDILAGCL